MVMYIQALLQSVLTVYGQMHVSFSLMISQFVLNMWLIAEQSRWKMSLKLEILMMSLCGSVRISTLFNILFDVVNYTIKSSSLKVRNTGKKFNLRMNGARQKKWTVFSKELAA